MTSPTSEATTAGWALLQPYHYKPLRRLLQAMWRAGYAEGYREGRADVLRVVERFVPPGGPG
jgi:hypothetical protein